MTSALGGRKSAMRNTIFSGLVAGFVLLWVGASACYAQDTQAEKIELPDWKTLSAAYAYDNKQVPEVKEEERKAENAYAIHVTFTNKAGEAVPGWFQRPKKEGTYPLVLLLHGFNKEQMVSKEQMVKSFGTSLVAKGYAVLALDAPHHGERKTQDDALQNPDTFAAAIHDGCLDYRRALDWLQTRKDVDMTRVGLLGYGMGSFTGAILGGVDTRIGALALCAGGDPIITFVPQVPINLRAQIFTICPSLYIEHIAPRPVLMLNGHGDRTVAESASKRLYDAAKDPKEQVWYDAGHVLPQPIMDKSIAWLVEKLKQDKKSASAECGVNSKGEMK